MKIYLGVGGDSRVHRFAKEHDCGWLMTPYNNRNKISDLPFILDNGKFSVWLNEQMSERRIKPDKWAPLKWDPDKFRRFVSRHSKKPGFIGVIVPDIVCPENPRDSLELSVSWADELPHPRYLAVQDGMTEAMVRQVLELFDGIFVGGSIQWKESTMRMWCDIAHLYKLKCHIGRCWGWESMIAAHFNGADSIDSTSASRHQDDSMIKMYKEALKTQTLLIRAGRDEWEPLNHLSARTCKSESELCK